MLGKKMKHRCPFLSFLTPNTPSSQHPITLRVSSSQECEKYSSLRIKASIDDSRLKAVPKSWNHVNQKWFPPCNWRFGSRNRSWLFPGILTIEIFARATKPTKLVTAIGATTSKGSPDSMERTSIMSRGNPLKTKWISQFANEVSFLPIRREGKHCCSNYHRSTWW